MPIPVRCFSTNSAIGEYYTVYVALRDYLLKNPPKEGEKTLLDYLHDFGIILYPQIMRITTHTSFIDAYHIHQEPHKNNI